jgi:3'-phosphoadenosine 5'-phosphosulfate sulfotransferase (PAPS reductase)/FAD synthetase
MSNSHPRAGAQVAPGAVGAARAHGAYRLPDGPIQIAFSGGRTSGFMLHALVEANHGLRDDVEVIFANTGREMPATLDFVAECGERWGVPITWLEYTPEPPNWTAVGHNSASRDGEPFAALIRKRGFLPNVVTRFCTTELKVRPAKAYLRDWRGWSRWTNALGIRADEAHRARQAPQERWENWYPLVAAGVTAKVVGDFWRRQPFDLRLDHHNGKAWAGNCDGCFLKSEAALARLAREHPDRAAWWQSMEAEVGASFSKRWSRAELHDFVARQGELDLDDGQLCQASGGECFG